jgi:hypothetical protein
LVRDWAILNPGGEVTYRNSFIADLAIGPNNVAEFAACGRPAGKSRMRLSTY